MTATVKSPVAFGSGCKRFGKLTVHPDLDTNGVHAVRELGSDPCRYYPRRLSEICEKRNKKNDKDPWRYKIELEEWARHLGYRNQKVLVYRQYQKSLLGPAWHDVHTEKVYEPACMNVGFGRTSRKIKDRSFTPGPGTYYHEVPFKAPYGPHSTRPTLEREEPCRFKDTVPSWSLAPNRYTIIDKDSIENKPKKIVSLRGPYDLFTKERDGRSIKNHFNTSNRVSAKTWPLALPGSFESLKKTHIGELNKSNRDKPYKGRIALMDIAMCLRRPEDPGPAHYAIGGLTEFKQYKYGFNSSYDRPPGYQKVIVWPGVGRYKVERVRCGLPGKGHKHVFLSKQQRTIGAILPQPMNSF